MLTEVKERREVLSSCTIVVDVVGEQVKGISLGISCEKFLKFHKAKSKILMMTAQQRRVAAICDACGRWRSVNDLG